MSNLAFLIFFPFVMAFITYIVKDEKVRGILVVLGSLVIIAADVIFCITSYLGGDTVEGIKLIEEAELYEHVIMAAEVFLVGLVTYLSIKYKKYYCILLSLLGTVPVLYMDINKTVVKGVNRMMIDNLTLIMFAIVGVVGGLICIYAVGYLHSYHEHHKDIQNRSYYFQALLFVFLGAMFGLIASDDLTWIFFFWEITSIVSFLLIGYPRSKES
ncbi:MAG: NADH-quinone oxidoreductase subunit L, partial [Lachnospiraceae bacterium]|nr:NADH-quinone oxidoreductase subunit L [Lachnospiraceae bacterium]